MISNNFSIENLIRFCWRRRKRKKVSKFTLSYTSNLLIRNGKFTIHWLADIKRMQNVHFIAIDHFIARGNSCEVIGRMFLKWQRSLKFSELNHCISFKCMHFFNYDDHQPDDSVSSQTFLEIFDTRLWKFTLKKKSVWKIGKSKTKFFWCKKYWCQFSLFKSLDVCFRWAIELYI